MTLSEFLKAGKETTPLSGTVGVETNWMSVCTLNVTRGSLWVGDPYVADAEAGFVTKVVNGAYLLEAKAMDFEGTRVVSRIRAILTGAEDVKRGRKTGETLTDTGMLAICDIKALDQAIGTEIDGFQNEVMNHDFQDCGVIPISVGNGFELPYVSSAFGDCDGPVFILTSGKSRVGIEIELLPSGYVLQELDG